MDKLKNGNMLKLLLLFFIAVASVAAIFFYAIKVEKGHEIAKAKTDIPKVQIQTLTKKNIKILFVGDMMLDRYIRQTSDSRGADFVFQGVDSLLKSEDLVVGNLEGPITDNVSASVNSVVGSKDNYVFTFDPKVAQTLKSENISLVNIGNNHITNFGDAGVASTGKYLASAGVGYFGDPKDSSKRIAIEDIGGFKIAFVNYDQFVADGEQRTLDDLKVAKSGNADLIVVYTHWGTEFVTEPNDKIKNLGHEFIDSGADLIIGSHPHVIQSKEKYKGKMIYYSLGNFIFDQYFDPKTQEGLAVQVDIDTASKNIDFKEAKLQLKNSGQTILEN